MKSFVAMRGMIVGACVIALAATAGCGDNSAKNAACGQLKTTLSGISARAMRQTGDPGGIAQSYTNSAQTVRDEGKNAGGKVETAADQTATALENLGAQLRDMRDGNAPDVSTFVTAATNLNKTCGS